MCQEHRRLASTIITGRSGDEAVDMHAALLRTGAIVGPL